MDKIKIKVNGKINLTLDVTGIYGEGYHELDMVMASVNVYDTITVKSKYGIQVFMNGKHCGEENIAFRTAELCVDKFGLDGLSVNIKKGIPFSAGMGGSSADASAVLYAVSKIYGIDYNELLPIAKKLGSDITYMYNGGSKRALGKGDDLIDLPFIPLDVVIVKPKYGANTGEVFKKFDLNSEFTDNTINFIANIKDMNMARKYMKNGLQKSATEVNNGIADALRELEKYSNTTLLTGSGSAVYAVMENEDNARRTAEALKGKFPFVKYAKTVDYGIKELEWR